MTINREYKSLDPTTKQGFQKGQTVCLIQLVLVTGQGSSFTTQRIPIAQFFLSYWEQIKDLHSSIWITVWGREKMKCEFQPWVHTLFPISPVGAVFMKARKFHMEYPRGTNPADPALMAVFYVPLFIFFFMSRIGWIEQGWQCNIMDLLALGALLTKFRKLLEQHWAQDWYRTHWLQVTLWKPLYFCCQNSRTGDPNSHVAALTWEGSFS